MRVALRWKRHVPAGKYSPLHTVITHPSLSLQAVLDIVDAAVYGDGIIRVYTNDDEIHTLKVQDCTAIAVVEIRE